LASEDEVATEKMNISCAKSVAELARTAGKMLSFVPV
jgi:hypothetical protein